MQDPAEWFRIYWLFLLIPIGTGIGAWIVTGLVFSLPIDKVITATLTVGFASLGFVKLLQEIK